jgi:hypothetical protein
MRGLVLTLAVAAGVNVLPAPAQQSAPAPAASTSTHATHPPQGAIARAMADLTSALREASLQAQHQPHAAAAIPPAAPPQPATPPAKRAATGADATAEKLAGQPPQGGGR